MNSREKASRFLMQATLGANYRLIEEVANIGIEPWLDNQLDNKWGNEDSFLQTTRNIWRGKESTAGFKQLLTQHYGEPNINGEGNNPALPYKYYFRMAWWHKTLLKGNSIGTDNQRDGITQAIKVSDFETDTSNLVRHRVAQALSEILVISDNSVLELDAEGMADFYDLLYKHALGSYKDLLTDVSLHPCMGVYLTHINNRKEDVAKRIHPDENYAREIMQLFTIGLFELNSDGSHKKDAAGKDMPTYDNDDIKELAKVFTGIKAQQYLYEWPNANIDVNGFKVPFASINRQTVELGDDVSKVFKILPYVDMLKPTIADDSFHDLSAKSLLKGKLTLPARSASGGQATLNDIKSAVAQLVANPNTAPFIAKKLIQQLVTSNPTPQYVQAVAAKFGSEGDLKAVVREILTYPLSNKVTIGNGSIGNIEKLKSPLLRVTQLLRAFNVYNDEKRLWLIGEDIKAYTSQHTLSSPTVFNFYKPDFVPHGKIEDANKVAPEFELYNAHTSISYVNMMYDWLFGDALPLVSTQIKPHQTPPHPVPELDADILLANTRSKLKLNLSEELKLATKKSDYPALISRVSLLLTGKETPSNQQDILTTLAPYDPSSTTQQLWIVQTVIFMIAIAPEFTVLEV